MEGGSTNFAIPVLSNASPEIICSVFGRVTSVTLVRFLKVPFSVVNPDADKSTEPTQLLKVDVVALVTVTLPPPEQL
jgi:hypothetical protein